MKNPLGESANYRDQYDRDLLFPIERAAARATLGIKNDGLPFSGHDLWNCYELSWLDPAGRPLVAIGRLKIPCESLRLVESKSLKLYLNSFNNTPFDSPMTVRATIEGDLMALLGTAVEFSLELSAEWSAQTLVGAYPGNSIDLAPLVTPPSSGEPLITANGPSGRQRHYSHLLRTLCPVTGQPDWGSLLVEYDGAEINHSALLAYIISLRNHQGFHEECCERIFLKILRDCAPKGLAVSCLFTRRGGIDINPLRITPGFTHHISPDRCIRQ